MEKDINLDNTLNIQENDSEIKDIELLENIPQEEFTDEDLSDEQLLSDFNDSDVVLDALKQYLLSIGKYKLLTSQEEKELAKRKEEGDLEARQILIVHNLRLVVFVARRLSKIANRIDLIDLISEGNLGLMRAVEDYDGRCRFSTYAHDWIYSYIRRFIDLNVGPVHVPIHLVELENKYKKFRAKYLEEHGVEPPKELVMEMYNIKESTYQSLISMRKNIVQSRSLSEVIGNESSEESILEDFVPDVECGYNDFETELDKRIYMFKLRESLTPLEYFVVYYRFLTDNPRSLEVIGNILMVTRERVRQIEAKAINRAKNIVKADAFKNSGISIKHIMKENFLPPNVEDVAILTVLKEKLSEYDYFIFYYVWYKKEKVSDVADRLGMSRERIESRINFIVKDNIKLLEEKKYTSDLFKKMASEQGGGKVYNSISKLDPTFNLIVEVTKAIKCMSYEEVLNMLGDNYLKFNEHEKGLIDCYFNRKIRTIYSSELEEVRAKINVSNSHYTDSPYLDKKILYKIMMDRKDEYTPHAIEYLCKTYFKEESGYKGPAPIGESLNLSYYLNLFERIYYDLDSYFTYFIPKEDVERIVFGTKYRFTDEEKRIMTLMYGLKGERVHTLVEMSDICGLNYIAMHDKYHSINYKVIDIYVGRHVMNNYSNPERYAKYINDKRYIMTDEAREASRLYFLEGKTYKEIVDIMGIRDTTRVSNILTESARTMDFWEYGMIDFPIFEADLVEKVFENYDFTDEEKKAILLRTEEGKVKKEVAKLLSLAEKDVANLFNKFNNAYVLINAKDELTIEDFKQQVLCRISDSILSEEERKITALLHGIKCSYNPTGEVVKKSACARMLGYTFDDIHYKHSQIKRLLCRYKLGLLSVQFSEITYDELKEILRDPHVPITDYEKDLLRAVKGMDGRVYSIGELAKKYDIKSVSSITRRVNRAILTIKKYQAGEIDKKLIYDIDIAPILKYFGEYHRRIINMRYRDNMRLVDIAKKLGVSKNSLDSQYSKIERKVLYLLKNKKAKKFDFDYAREVIHKPDLPFYGDFDVAYKYYLRMSGEDGERPSLANIDDERVANQKANASIHYYMLMVAVLKYRDGIRKVEKIDADDLEKFYLENREKYSKDNQKTFEITIKNLRKVYPVFGRKTYSTFVINEYIKSKGEDTFSFDNMTRGDAKRFIRTNPYNLTKVDLEKIRNYFGITRYEMMSGKQQFKLLKLISPYALAYIQKKNDELEKLKQHGRDDAKKYRNIDPNIVEPKLSSRDLVPYLKTIKGDGVFITEPVIDLIFAHIKAKHNNIDVLSMQDIFEYIYYLECMVMQKGDCNDFYNFFNKSWYSNIQSFLKEGDPKVVAFFGELFSNSGNSDIFKSRYDKTDLAALCPQYQNENFKEFKNRVKSANVAFVDDIPNKHYDVINMSDELAETSVDVAREIIHEYEEYLGVDGKLVGYFKDDTLIPEIFADKEYEVLDVRRAVPKVGRGKTRYDMDKAVVMKKI